MSSKQPTEKELLKQVLEPLLDDFLYWFARSVKLLESERLSFFSTTEQANLLQRLKTAQKEVSTAKMMFNATDGAAGIDSQILLPWHNLVAECWDVARLWRQSQTNESDSLN